MSTLPAELWDHLLSLLSPRELQHTALALSRALATPSTPASHISHALLWRFLQVKREGQAWQCIQRLREEAPGTAEAVRSVNVEVWRDDAQLLINLLLSLPALRSLSLSVGPLAAPEHLDDLVSPASLARTGRWNQLEQLSFRFNPYVSERSYYTFLKGTYFDSLLHALTNVPPSSAPKLRRLAFAQDLPPTHGAVRKETLAFGLHDLADSFDQVQISSIKVPTSGRYGRKLKTDKMEFAQPIIFFQLAPLTLLAQSPLAANLTHLTFRLPRRNLLTALTDFPISPLHKPPFPSLKHLDLSTTHVVDDARFPTLLRMLPTLESLVLDRCSGLISAEAMEEPTAVATLRWLGKCCGGIGLSRAEDALRAWRRIAKDRPADAPNLSRPSRPSSTRTSTAASTRAGTPATDGNATSAGGNGGDSLVPPVRDLVLIPPPSALKHLGLGLHDLPPRATALWHRAFFEGYRDALRRAVEKAEEGVERWERWGRQGVLGDGTRRLCTFEDAVEEEEGSGEGGERRARAGEGEEDEDDDDPDPTFARFSRLRRLVPLSPSRAKSLLSTLLSQLDSPTFSFCPPPACSNAPGVPHLSLAAATALGGFGEADPEALGGPAGGKKKLEGGRKTKEEEAGERREKERKAWDDEAREERAREESWEERHTKGCAHERAREAWGLEQFA
ncbi:hypothetical protein JCM6882_009122 [Rhodosporidiobolus microsporus]